MCLQHMHTGRNSEVFLYNHVSFCLKKNRKNYPQKDDKIIPIKILKKPINKYVNNIVD